MKFVSLDQSRDVTFVLVWKFFLIILDNVLQEIKLMKFIFFSFKKCLVKLEVIFLFY